MRGRDGDDLVPRFTGSSPSMSQHNSKSTRRAPWGGKRASANLDEALDRLIAASRFLRGRQRVLVLDRLGERVLWYAELFPGRVHVLEERPFDANRLALRVAVFRHGIFDATVRRVPSTPARVSSAVCSTSSEAA